MTDYKYYLNQCIEYTNKKDFDKALELVEKSLELNPENALAYFSKAIIYHNLMQLRAAYENYDKAISLDKNMIDAYFNKAQTILAFDSPTNEELKEALEDLNIAVSMDEKFIDAHYSIAVIKKKLGDYEGAIASLDKILEIQPISPYSKALKKLIEQKYL